MTLFMKCKASCPRHFPSSLEGLKAMPVYEPVGWTDLRSVSAQPVLNIQARL
jgi:hypothetical protein